MDAFYNWHQIRGIAVLLAIGVFLHYAWLLGTWQKRANRRSGPTMDQDSVDTVAPKVARDVPRRGIEVRRTGQDNIPPVAPARRAA
jgi:hypothetical protein